MDAQFIVSNLLLMLAIILVIGSLSAWFSNIVKLPDTILFIFSGIIIGPLMLGFVDVPTDSVANLLIITFGAAFIIYDGGREIELKILNDIKFLLLSLATIGVLVSATIIGFIASWLFDIDFATGFLMGAILSPTDPSVLVPLFKKIHISPKLKQLIIAESALNDATGAVLAVAAKTIVLGGGFSLLGSAGDFAFEAIGGLILGLVVGIIFNSFIGNKKFGILKDYPTQVMLSAVLVGYALASLTHVSGFMTVFIVGIVCENMRKIHFCVPPSHMEGQTRFKDELTLIMRMMIFILLGTHIDMQLLLDYWWQLTLMSLVLIFIARPVSVLVAVGLSKSLSWREIVYMTWIREVGVMPAALAGMMVAANVPYADIILATTFFAILITLVLQASTSAYLAKILALEVKKDS